MKVYSLLFFTTCFVLMSQLSFSQGCSDAGVCSVGSLNIIQFKYEYLPAEKQHLEQMKAEDTELMGDTEDLPASRQGTANYTPPQLKEKKTDPAIEPPTKVSASIDTTAATDYSPLIHYYKYAKYSFQFTAQYGIGDRSTSILISELAGNIIIIKQKLFGQVKLPYYFINGELGSVNGVGDITLSLSYFVFNKNRVNISVTGGAKIPTNNANLTIADLPLPMVYQTSLGSTDALLGIKLSYKKWDFTLGYQHSFNSIGNQYLHNFTVENVPSYNNYFESNIMKRADDAVFRVNRNFKFKKIIIHGGLLFIYHTANDDVTNASGERVKVNGSKGLTLNLNIAGTVPVSKDFDVVFTFANPFITRKSRPDGLARKVVIIAGVKYNLFKN